MAVRWYLHFRSVSLPGGALKPNIEARSGAACEVELLLAEAGISLAQFREQSGGSSSRMGGPLEAGEIDAALAYLEVPRETLETRVEHRARFPSQVALLDRELSRLFDSYPSIQEVWRSVDGRDRSVVLYIQTFEMNDVERIARVLGEDREYLKLTAPDSPIRLVSRFVGSRINGHCYDGLINWTGEHAKRIASRPLAPA